MKRIYRIIASVLALAIITTACGDEYVTSETDPTEDTVAGNGDSGLTPGSGVVAPEASAEIIAMLTVTTVDLSKCLALTGAEDVGVVTYNVGALELPVPQGPRLWGDAISVPLVETEPLKQLGETQTSICEDPLLGATWGHFFSQMEVGGRKLIDLNPWLETFNVSEDQIDDIATGFIPLLDAAGDPSDELKAEALEKAVEWQVLAAKVNTLLERFTVLWVDEQQSLLNYHLVAGGLVVGALPEVGLNPNQESLPALMLVVTEKGACVPIKVIGINVGDRRPEEFAPPVCETPPTDTPTDTPTTVPSEHTTPTTNPGRTTTTTQPDSTTTTTTVPGSTTTTTVPSSTTTTTTVPSSTTTTTTTVPSSTTTTTTLPCPPPRVRKGGVCEFPPPSPAIPPAATPTGPAPTTIGPSPTAPPDPTPTGPINTVNPPVITVPSNTGGGPTPGVTIPPTTAPLPTTPPATIPPGTVVSD